MKSELASCIRRSILAVIAAYLVGALLGAVPQAPGSAPPYTRDYAFTDLGILGTPRAINDNGIIVGSGMGADGYPDPVLWVNGAQVALELLGGNEGMAYDVNDNRLVVGWAKDDQHDKHAVRWYNRVAYSLGFLGDGDDAEAHAVNNLGHIVGWSQITTGGYYRGFFWDGSQMEHIRTFTGGYGEAWGINDQDVVVGFCDWATFDKHAFYWIDGVTKDLGGLPSYYSAYALDINEAGVIAGYCDVPGGEKTTIWDGDTIFEVPTTGYSNNELYAINDHGHVVGRSVHGRFLWRGGEVLYLDDLLPPGSDWTISDAFDINNYEQIVGAARTDAGVWRGYLMSPLPHLLVTDTLKPSDTIDVSLEGQPGDLYYILWAPEAGSLSVGWLPFDIDLGPDFGALNFQFMGVIPASGFATHSVVTPPDGTLYSQDFFWQGFTFGSGPPQKSNRMQTLFRIGGA